MLIYEHITAVTVKNIEMKGAASLYEYSKNDD